MANIENTLQAFIAPFKRDEKDDGSPEVQVAQLTYEIAELQGHLKQHDKDVDAKRSLLKKVARRRKFMKYLKENALERYNLLVKKLGLKG
jgi:small subunit ribosomal protein S15